MRRAQPNHFLLLAAFAVLFACARPAATGTVILDVPPCHVVGATRDKDVPFLSGGIALDSKGNLYVAETGEAPDAKGNPRSGIRVYSQSDLARAVPISHRVDSGYIHFQDPALHIAPIRTIYLPRQPQQRLPLALDSDRYIYTVDFHTHGGILVFDQRASGNASPLWKIRGPRTRVTWPADLAIDDAGNLYVANNVGLDDPALVLAQVIVFARGQRGDPMPVRAISGKQTGLHGARAVAVAADAMVAVSGGGALHWPVPYLVNFYSPRAEGDVAPIRQLRGSPRILDDLLRPNDFKWLKANGLEAELKHSYPGAMTYELRNATKLNDPLGIAFDRQGRLWVANSGVYRVTEYAPDANGNAKPLLMLQGDQTGLIEPLGIAIDAEGDVFVSNFGLGTVNEYCGLARQLGP
jgi:hypothetical protein